VVHAVGQSVGQNSILSNFPLSDDRAGRLSDVPIGSQASARQPAGRLTGASLSILTQSDRPASVRLRSAAELE
jgi:hypothetical protein